MRLVKMIKENARSNVRIHGELSEQFRIGRSLRQGDILQTLLFNLVLEKALLQGVTRNVGDAIFIRNYQYLAYGDDVPTIARKSRGEEIWVGTCAQYNSKRRKSDNI